MSYFRYQVFRILKCEMCDFVTNVMPVSMLHVSAEHECLSLISSVVLSLSMMPSIHLTWHNLLQVGLQISAQFIFHVSYGLLPWKFKRGCAQK